MTIVLVALAAGLGGAARHGINQLGWGWVGTLAVNVTGSGALGWLIAWDASPDAVTVLGTGLLGALTTFSTFAIEVVEAPRWRRLLIVSANVGAGLAAAAVGVAVA